MLGEFDPQDALHLIARRAREVSGSMVGAVMLAQDHELVIEAVDGPPAFRAYVGRRLPENLPILGDVLTGDEQVVVDDVAQLVKELGHVSELPEMEQLGRTSIAPLPPGTTSTGGLLVVAAARGQVSGIAAGTDMLRVFASQTTLALERAKAIQDRSIIAVLEDRDRIARDLHDLVIQRLFATGLQLQGAHRMARPEVQERITRSVEDIDATIRDLRAAIFELHRQPGQSSLRADVQALVAEYAEPLGFRPELICSGPLDTAVPATVRPQILAAIRESLSNVVRHAQASSVLVEVAVGAGEVKARIADDGVGISTHTRQSGLRNLRERAESLGGTVTLSPNEPHGTVLELRAPVDASSDRL